MLERIENYFRNVGRWEKELRMLGEIATDNGLEESFKWKHPCYMFQGKNVILIGEFAEYCSMTFIKGVLMEDPYGILKQVTKNVQAERILKITSMEQIKSLKSQIGEYIQEAIAIEKSGKKVPMKTTEDYEVPEELTFMFNEMPDFKEAFEGLTPGRQRGYLLHYAGAKQSKTRMTRIENSMERVFLGKGLTDCICGKSKHMPRCDGSHKAL